MYLKDKIKTIKRLRLPKDEVFLIETFNKCEKFYYKGGDYYMYNNEVYFEYKFGILSCDFDKIWMVLGENIKTYQKLHKFISVTMSKYYNIEYDRINPHRYITIDGYDKHWTKVINAYKRSRLYNKIKFW